MADVPSKTNLLRALLDAIVGEDNKIAGQAFTRLSAPLPITETAQVQVESSIGFGENTDGVGDARLLIGNEVVLADSSTGTTFDTLTRGDLSTVVKAHPAGTVVMDFSRNKSALDHLYRGFVSNYAVGADLDVIGRNIGLRKCPGLDDNTWRSVIQTVAYLPKQTLRAFERALEALYGASNFEVYPDFDNPYLVRVQLPIALGAAGLQGRFFLNGGEEQLTTGLTTVVVDETINQVLGVYLDTPLARRGLGRLGTNFYAGGGSFLGSTITLGSSPGPIGTAVIVDYGSFEAHFLSDDSSVIDPLNKRPFLSDPGATARCLLDQIRAAGVSVAFSYA